MIVVCCIVCHTILLFLNGNSMTYLILKSSHVVGNVCQRFNRSKFPNSINFTLLLDKQLLISIILKTFFSKHFFTTISLLSEGLNAYPADSNNSVISSRVRLRIIPILNNISFFGMELWLFINRLNVDGGILDSS